MVVPADIGEMKYSNGSTERIEGWRVEELHVIFLQLNTLFPDRALEPFLTQK